VTFPEQPISVPDLLFPVSSTGLADKVNLTQDVVMGLLKESAVKNNPGITGPLGDVFQGLPAGVPMVLGAVAKMVEQFTGIPVSTWVDQWQDNPVPAHINTVLADAFGKFFTVSANIQALLGSLNFLDPDFSVEDAAVAFVNAILTPTGLLATLTGGLLNGSWIPGLDASKIVSGTFGDSLLPSVGDLRDAIYQAIHGGSTTGTSAAQTKTALQNIPGSNLVGSIASSLLSGTIGAGLIPSLDASKITTGTFGDAFVPIVGQVRDAIGQAVDGGSATGYTAAQVKSKLQAFPGGNLVGSVASSLLSGTLTAGLIPSLDASKITTGTFAQSMVANLVSDLGGKAATTAVTAVTNTAQSIIDNFYNAWHGSSTTGNAPTAVTTTTVDIKATIAGGLTIQPFTSSNHAWPIPAGVTRMYAGVFNGADGGNVGNSVLGGLAAAVPGGLDGGFLWKEIDLTGLTPGVDTLDVTVGAGASSPGGTGGPSSVVASTGTLISCVSGQASIANTEGYYLTSSGPGSGGAGGQANSAGPTGSAGAAGGTTAVATTAAAGGAGRNNSGTATAGQNGGAGSATVPLCGGGGGGGGGGAAGTSLGTYIGGRGGDGGFPAGGPGSGGSVACSQALATRNPGQPGTAANGEVVLAYK
jgi:hypothetical protein